MRSKGLIELIPPDTESLLDVGCNVGAFVNHASQLGIKHLCGVDINANAIERAKEIYANREGLEFHHCSADQIPLENESIDVITCSEVLEHIPEELRPKVIDEFCRILKPNSKLIITVPFNGLFSFLDPSNIRFRFPTFHKFAASLLAGDGRDAGYEGTKHGVVWHHHFTFNELEKLLKEKFSISLLQTRGFLITPIGEWLLFPFYRKQKFEHPFFRGVKTLQNWEMSWILPKPLAYNILLTAQKAAAPRAHA